MAVHDGYRLYAVRYACINRVPRDNVLLANRGVGSSTMDYYVWVARSEERTVVIDTGFAPEDAEPRHRTALHPVADGLRALDVGPGDVHDVILTHLHNDHAGGTGLFPQASFHLQTAELRFATGPAMRHSLLSGAYDDEDLGDVVRLAHAGRVVFHDGSAVIAPGIEVHRLGGHTPGLQVVTVATSTGVVVLASDAAHFYENLHDRNPFPVLVDLDDVLSGLDRLEALAASPAHVVPGHDPAVLLRYPPPREDLAGWIAQLDAVPSTGQRASGLSASPITHPAPAHDQPGAHHV